MRGPFKILEAVGNRAFKLDLPSTMRIHPTFHMGLLEPYKKSEVPGRVQSPPLPQEAGDEEEWEIEEIGDSRKRGRKNVK